MCASGSLGPSRLGVVKAVMACVLAGFDLNIRVLRVVSALYVRLRKFTVVVQAYPCLSVPRSLYDK
jgi:hypothetical protein